MLARMSIAFGLKPRFATSAAKCWTATRVCGLRLKSIVMASSATPSSARASVCGEASSP
jgi:hypothetical protein